MKVKYIIIPMLVFICSGCFKKSEISSYYFGIENQSKGLKIVYSRGNYYMTIEEENYRGNTFKYLEIYGVKEEFPDTTWGLGTRIGSVEKRLAYFNKDNAVLQIKDDSTRTGDLPEFAQIIDGQYTDESFMIHVSEASSSFILRPLYKKDVIDSLALKFNNTILDTGIDSVLLSKDFVNETLNRSIQLEIWVEDKSDSTFYQRGFTITLSKSRILNYKSIQDFNDSLRSARFKAYLHPKIKQYLKERIETETPDENKY